MEDREHYTFSKIGCWLALSNAAELARNGHIAGNAERWEKESERIRGWIDEHCWSEAKQCYKFHAGTERLDAALLLTSRFGFEHEGRLAKTRAAIEREFAVGPLVCRYSGVVEEEGTFVACSCWLVEAYAFLGEVDRAGGDAANLAGKARQQFRHPQRTNRPSHGRWTWQSSPRVQPSRIAARNLFDTGKKVIEFDRSGAHWTSVRQIYRSAADKLAT
ncbi:glycoside hydrolase family 15 protein [Rhizobium lentis]|uniref:glycoside hydrolase family 15 protein n=1 Tax=Rhizobium lentis TaxID=1138194 RepID=UPI001A936133|nr:glycoside hydrolase family 15 protein [Rhizobium lentis]MBX5001048.1 hypothetical protein [Rhizobium lentis]MBX5068314.1 hypothetical protein [Rhizobium lentis]MBX5080644.1 hypothetical protein [Rhizobium lentis]QSW94575.1 hypothetical protein J0663_04805 [Rhizobium lentis]